MSVRTVADLLTIRVPTSTKVGQTDLQKPSRFRQQEIYTLDGVSVLAHFRPPTFHTDTSDLIRPLQGSQAYRPDLLAFDLYRNQQAWWVLALLNRTWEPLLDWAPGRSFRLPTLTRLYGSLLVG